MVISNMCEISYPPMLSHRHPRLGHIPGGHLQPGLLPVSARTRGGLFSSSATAAMLVHAAGIFGSHDRSRLVLIGYVFVLGAVCAQFRIVQADCWYDGQRHDEQSEVPTGEPCLNCTCSRSVLLCYLRVCPKLPNPPPSGCILLHRYRTCCPELICSDFHDGGNSLEARSDPEGGLDIPSDDQSAYENACISNGTIYGPGSAMHSSSLCEYCYCLAGKQVCVKPKCLLPIEGCNPIFEDTSCCPVRYNCTTNSREETSTEPTTTTVISTSTEAKYKDGCVVDDTYYPEGSKVIGVGHSVCDNCYCLRSLLRCEPLSCAPPLLGCAPIVKPGDCCAASYNCNGTLEIEPEPNYGLFPTISKEYSKLRKEVHRKSPTKHNKDGVVTVEPFYVLAETLQDPTTKFVYQRSPDTYGTTRHFSGGNYNPSSTQNPLRKAPSTSEDNFYLISSSKHKSAPSKPVVKHRTVPGVFYATTNYEFQNANYKRVYSTTFRSNERSLPTKVRAQSTVSPSEAKEEPEDDYLGFENLNIFSIVDSLLDGKLYGKRDNKSEIKPNNDVLNTTETIRQPVENYLAQSTGSSSSAKYSTADIVNLNIETTVKPTDETDIPIAVMEPTTITTEKDVESASITEEYNGATTVDDPSDPITFRSVLKSTDCIDNVEPILEKDNQNIEVTTILPLDPSEVNKLAEIRTEFLTTTDFDFEDSSSENFLTEETAALDVDSRNEGHGAPNIETILNISKHKNAEDFDYDYNEPTLPPSLPNLKIIPFVAADALDSKKEAPKDPTPVYIDKKIDDEPFEYNTNLFSPPVKTEGGFVPKEPPTLDTFYNNVVSVPSLTHQPSGNVNINCISNSQEVRHGMSVPSDSPCMTCTCFYGNIVCQKPNCPPPKPGCTKVAEQGATLCCPNYICGEPNLSVLNRHDIPQEIVTVAEGIMPADPFRDVIRTEPAPNLQSLIGDMISFQRITSTTILPTFVKDSTISEDPKPETTTSNSEGSFSFDDFFKFMFSGGSPDVSEQSTSKESIQWTENGTTENSSTASPPESAKLPQYSSAPWGSKNNSAVFKNSSMFDSIRDSTPSVTSSTKLAPLRSNTTKNNESYMKLDLFANTNRRKTTSTKFGDQTNSVDAVDKTENKDTNTKVKFNKDSKYKSQSNKNGNVVGVGLLKLAGCNIYGRMYRVGRIISELSGPCLECKCTDVGVQCTPLDC